MQSQVARAVLLVLLGLGTAACGIGGLGQDRILDTWPVGTPLRCAGHVADGRFVADVVPVDPADGVDTAGCLELVTEALRGMAARDEAGVPVVSAALHREGTVRRNDGKQILMTRSGRCCYVLVAGLEDGTERAIGVGYPGISRTPVAISRETVLAPGS